MDGIKCFTLSLASFVLAAPCVAQFATVPASKAELLAGVRSHRGAVATLRVTYSANMLNPREQHAHARQNQTITTKGDLFLWDVKYGKRADVDPSTHHRVVSFDGSRSVSIHMTLGQAVIQATRPLDAMPQGKAYFDLAMLSPPQIGQFAPDDQSLITLLESSMSNVRPNVEVVGTTECTVVDLIDDPTRAPRVSVWIDTARGFIPVRQVWRPRGNRDGVLLEFRVEELHEFPGGVWLPVRGRGACGPLPSVPGSGPEEWEVIVDRDAHGSFAVEVNEPVPDSFFDLSSRIPPGFTVTNMDTREFWTAAGTDYNAAADSIVTVLANTRHGIPVQASAVDLSTEHRASLKFSLPFALAGGLAALVLTPLVIHRSRP